MKIPVVVSYLVKSVIMVDADNVDDAIRRGEAYHPLGKELPANTDYVYGSAQVEAEETARLAEGFRYEWQCSNVVYFVEVQGTTVFEGYYNLDGKPEIKKRRKNRRPCDIEQLIEARVENYRARPTPVTQPLV